MKLIEQLGGYANAKFLISAMTEGTSMEFNGVLSNRQQLCEVLSKYRRQHNIYEVGDKVVFVSDKLSCGVKEIVEIINNNWVVFKQAGFHVKLVRHATDAEIKAGKRLEIV